jgi:transposase
VARASTGEGLARVAMDFYKRLYRIERQATAHELTPEQRWALRQAHARPLMAEFKDWLESHHPSVLPKSTLGKAFHYALVRWDGFCTYLDDGRIEIDNNLTEQQVKPFVIARNYAQCVIM